MLVELLPRLSAPVGADLQAHVPNKQWRYGHIQSQSDAVSLQTARCWPAVGCVGLEAAVQFGVVHLGDRGCFGVTYGGRVCATQEALPQRVLRERLTATLTDQTVHDLLLGAHGVKNTLTGRLTVSLLRPVTAVQTWAQTHGILGKWVISPISFSEWIQNLKAYTDCTQLHFTMF